MTVPGKMVIACFLIFSAVTGYSQNLFTYGNQAVSKDEFLKAFNKNNTGEQPTGKVYRDYLDLYINFKLKVQAALDSRLDTMPNQLAELTGFRNQVVENYMKDEGSVDILVNEAFQRSLKDIHLAHIFIAINNTTPAEVKRAENKINEAYSQLQKGQDFAKVAATYSEDSSVKNNNGDIGYITLFTLPYQLENIAYSTPVGKYAAPVRSSVGFHVFKNLGERRAMGKIKAAQILLSFPPGATAVEKQQVKKQADSMYHLVLNNGDFKALAGAFSDDNMTYQVGGEMMEFGIGRYDPAFETAAFALEKDGAVSRPVLTEYGYHIIKRLKRIPVIDDSTNAVYRDELKQQVQQSDRMSASRSLFIKKMLQSIAFKKNVVNEKNLWILTDSILENKKAPAYQDLNSSTALFSFTGKTVTVKDWQAYLQNIRNYNTMRAGKTNAQLYNEFAEATALAYYRDRLEEYNKEFAFQLKEFREGNLLFEVMQRTIWDVAASDSGGLKNYYDAHKEKYWWEPSADAIIFTAGNEQIAEETKKKLQADFKSWQKYIDAGNGLLLGDSGRFELSQVPVLERTNFTPRLITASVKNETDNSFTFAYIIKVYNNREPRSFADARGFVINDYQGFLEEKWITALRKKYPVNINESVFANLPR